MQNHANQSIRCHALFVKLPSTSKDLDSGIKNQLKIIYTLASDFRYPIIIITSRLDYWQEKGSRSKNFKKEKQKCHYEDFISIVKCWLFSIKSKSFKERGKITWKADIKLTSNITPAVAFPSWLLLIPAAASSSCVIPTVIFIPALGFCSTTHALGWNCLTSGRTCSC